MVRLRINFYREAFEGMSMLLLGNLCSYGGQLVMPALLVGLVGVILSNHYHALRGRWVAAMVGVVVSSLLFLVGLFL